MFEIFIAFAICAADPYSTPAGVNPQCTTVFAEVFHMENMEFCLNEAGPKGIEIFQVYATESQPYVVFQCRNTAREFDI